MATDVGAITSKMIDAVPACTVIFCAVSGAVRIVLTPLAVESVPAVAAPAALPRACVSLTSSPTPIVVRVRGAGDVTTVWLVIVSGGAGVGPGGVGVGPGGVGVGPGGVGVGPGGVGAGPGNNASSAPMVSGPTRPSGL